MAKNNKRTPSRLEKLIGYIDAQRRSNINKVRRTDLTAEKTDQIHGVTSADDDSADGMSKSDKLDWDQFLEALPITQTLKKLGKWADRVIKARADYAWQDQDFYQKNSRPNNPAHGDLKQLKKRGKKNPIEKAKVYLADHPSIAYIEQRSGNNPYKKLKNYNKKKKKKVKKMWGTGQTSFIG